MNPLDIILDYYEQMFAGGSDDFKACFLAGVPMELTSEMTEGGMKITATTVDRCAVVRDPHTGQTTVYRRAVCPKVG